MVAFERRLGSDAMLVVAGRLFVGLAPGAGTVPALAGGDTWRGTSVRLPADWAPGTVMENLLTGERITVDGEALQLSEALRHVPWAAFRRVEHTTRPSW